MPDTAIAPVLWPAYLDDVDSLTARLRSAQVPVSIGDELRLRLLLDRLRARGTSITDPDAAARWLSPILCRNADHSKALLLTLSQLESESPRSDRRSTLVFSRPPAVDAQTDQEIAVAARVRRDRRVILAWIGVAALLALGLSAWYFVAPPPSPAPAVKPVEAVPCATPPCTAKPLPVDTPAPKDESIIDLWCVELGLVPMIAAMTFLMLRRRRRAFLMRGLVPKETPQVSRLLPVVIDVLFQSDRMRTPAADWRRDRWEESNRFDVLRSINRTVRAGGELKIVNGRRRIIPEYLLLVDRTGTNDMMAAVADHLAARLKAEQVNLSRFDYYGDPRRAIAADPGETRRRPQRLDDLLVALGGSHQLVILADPASAFDPMTGQARAWLAALSAWPSPIWMSPLPSSQQGAAERELQQRGFEIAETSCEGVAAVGRLLRRESHAALRPLPLHGQSALDAMLADPYRWTGDRPPGDADVAALIDELERALQPQAFALLAAVAVFPMTEPRLTLYVAERLSAAMGWTNSLETLVAPVSRLPWLRKGYVPEWLRVALVEWMERPPNRTLGATIRALWTQLLERADGGDGPSQPHEEATRDQLSIDFVRVAANSQVVSEQRLEKAIARNTSAFEERILLAFLTDTPVRQVALEAPLNWRDLAPRRWKVPEAIAMGLGLATAVAMVVWSGFLRSALSSIDLSSMDAVILAVLYGIVASSLVLIGSYLRQLPLFSRAMLSNAVAVVAAILAITSILLVGLLGIEKSLDTIPEAQVLLTLMTPIVGYAILWLSSTSSLRRRTPSPPTALFRRSPAICSAAATLIAFTLCLAITVAIEAVVAKNTRLAEPFETLASFIAVLVICAGLYTSLGRCVDVSVPRGALIGSALLHVLGAFAAAAAIYLMLDALNFRVRETGSLALPFIVAAVVCAPLAVTRWRTNGNSTIGFIYCLAALTLVLETAKALAVIVDARTLSVWFVPALLPAYMMAARFCRRPDLQLSGGAVLRIVLAMAFAGSVSWGVQPRLSGYPLEKILVAALPAIALGLEAGTFLLALYYSGFGATKPTRRSPSDPPLSSLIVGSLRLAWPVLLPVFVYLAIAAALLGQYRTTIDQLKRPQKPLPQQQQQQQHIPSLPPPTEPDKSRGTTPNALRPTGSAYMVFFDWDSSALSAQSLNTIKQAAAAFKAIPGARINVSGYTDTETDEKTALALTATRASAVRDALVRDGIPSESISAQGYGSQKPLVPTGPGAREPQNRRVEITLMEPASPPPTQPPTKQQAAPSKK